MCALGVHSAETSAERNVRLGAAEFFPGASRQVRRGGSGGGKECEGGAVNGSGSRVVYDTNLRSVGGQKRRQVGPKIPLGVPGQVPRPLLPSISLLARPPPSRMPGG